MLSTSCLADRRSSHEACGVVGPEGENRMAYFSPELINTMRAALDAVMTRVPVDQATPAVKATLAEFILKAAAQGETSYDGLITAATSQIQTILSMLS
jgi:hypothetical protein